MTRTILDLSAVVACMASIGSIYCLCIKLAVWVNDVIDAIEEACMEAERY